MKKILLVFTIVFSFFCLNLMAFDHVHSKEAIKYYKKSSKEPTKENYPIKKHHENLEFDCKTCHGEPKDGQYQVVDINTCKECHSSYESLAKRSEKLGYDDNIHNPPHYRNMECGLCHKSHEPSKNYCIMCHSQDSLQKILVP